MRLVLHVAPNGEQRVLMTNLFDQKLDPASCFGELYHQRWNIEDLLAFAGVFDDKLATIAYVHQLPEHVVRAACFLHRKRRTSPSYWQGWNRLRASMGAQCHAAFDAVAQAMAQTPRSNALDENLNSRLRNDFTLRRQLGLRVPEPAAVAPEPALFYA